MTNLYFGNAFSINMLSGRTTLMYIPLGKDQIKAEFILNPDFNLIPCIGHADTAHVVQNDMQLDNELFNRISVKPDFEAGDVLLVAQYEGIRLPEGTTTLPEGSKLTYWIVKTR